MLERAAQKLRLDQLVIQQGHQQQSKSMCSYIPRVTLLIFLPAVAANKEELLEMITHGAEKIINSNEAYA